MSDSTGRRHQSRYRSAQPRRPAPRQRPVVGKAFGKSHGNARADRRRQPHEKRFPALLRRKGRGKQRRQRGDRPIHQTSQPRLYHLQQKQFSVRFGFARFRARRQVFFFQLSRGLLVFSFLIRELVQQFSRGSVRRPARRSRVKPPRLHLHQFRLLPRHVHAQRAHQPHRSPLQKPLHVFPPDQWNMLPEPLPEHCEQTVAVSHFFLTHFLEHQRRGRIILAQRIRELPVNPPVFLFRRDADRQNLFFRQILEFFQPRPLPARQLLGGPSLFRGKEESHKPSRQVILSPRFPRHRPAKLCNRRQKVPN